MGETYCAFDQSSMTPTKRITDTVGGQPVTAAAASDGPKSIAAALRRARGLIPSPAAASITIPTVAMCYLEHIK
jgi:hypothetical protein